MLLSYTDEETQLIVICNLQVRYPYDDHNGFTKCTFCIQMTKMVMQAGSNFFLYQCLTFHIALKIGEEYSFADRQMCQVKYFNDISLQLFATSSAHCRVNRESTVDREVTDNDPFACRSLLQNRV